MNCASSKVSVIIPAFNREAYIAQTVDSVLEQTYPNVELIIVDDGSTDGTRKILESYGDRITLLSHPGEQNKGQSASINMGLKRASGRYIAILDSDDYWMPEKLTAMVPFLDHHLNVGLVYSNGYKLIQDTGEMFLFYPPGHRTAANPNEILLDCSISVPTNALVRTSVYEQIGGLDETLRAAQDHDLAIRISEVAKLAYIDEPLFVYRRHRESISAQKALLRWRNGFIILNKAKNRYSYPKSVVRKRAAVLHFRLFQCLRKDRKPINAIYHLTVAGLLDPVRSLAVMAGRERISTPH